MDLGTEIEKGGSRFHTIVGKILHHNTFNGRDEKWQFFKKKNFLSQSSVQITLKKCLNVKKLLFH